MSAPLCVCRGRSSTRDCSWPVPRFLRLLVVFCGLFYCSPFSLSCLLLHCRKEVVIHSMLCA